MGDLVALERRWYWGDVGPWNSSLISTRVRATEE